MTSLYDISWNFKVIEHRVNMNRFVNNFTQWVSSRNLTNPGVGSEEIPNFENNDHPTLQASKKVLKLGEWNWLGPLLVLQLFDPWLWNLPLPPPPPGKARIIKTDCSLEDGFIRKTHKH